MSAQPVPEHSQDHAPRGEGPVEHPVSARDPERRLSVAPSPEADQSEIEDVDADSDPEFDLELDDVVSWRDRVADVLELARQEVSPPDIWAADRPSLSKQVNYARWSEQMPPSGPSRAAALVWLSVSLTSTAAAYTVAWIAERPARSATAAVLLTLAATWGPSRAVLTVLGWPVHLLIELCTDLS